jgi:hypothetical protein
MSWLIVSPSLRSERSSGSHRIVFDFPFCIFLSKPVIGSYPLMRLKKDFLKIKFSNYACSVARGDPQIFPLKLESVHTDRQTNNPTCSHRIQGRFAQLYCARVVRWRQTTSPTSTSTPVPVLPIGFHDGFRHLISSCAFWSQLEFVWVDYRSLNPEPGYGLSVVRFRFQIQS